MNNDMNLVDIRSSVHDLALLRRFHRAGMIAVDQKRIKILDMGALAARAPLAR